jgi:hypothetical protein
MPTLARPEVDVLEGLTTAILVDQKQRMGADIRLTVGTATDANAMLRILFSRLGKPYIGPPNAFSFNVPSVRGSGAITVERGTKKTVRGRARRRPLHPHRPAPCGVRRRLTATLPSTAYLAEHPHRRLRVCRVEGLDRELREGDIEGRPERRDRRDEGQLLISVA